MPPMPIAAEAGSDYRNLHRHRAPDRPTAALTVSYTMTGIGRQWHRLLLAVELGRDPRRATSATVA